MEGIDAGNPIIVVASVVGPLVGATLIIVFRQAIIPWLSRLVPQRNERKIRAAIYVAAFAIAGFMAGWFLALFILGSPPALWLSILGGALLAWVVVWVLLANET